MLRAQSTSPVAHLMQQDDVQSVVHDLRSPMTVIKGNLQLLLSGVMGQMTQEQLMLIQRSVGPLEDLIMLTENLLQSSALEKNDLEITLEEIDLDQLVKETIEFYAPTFRQRHMELFRDGNTFGVKVKFDAFWMKRVLNNLIWNAYKFTPDEGRVGIRLERLGDGLELTIEDSGRGIPSEKLSGLFQKFHQAAPAKDKKIGTGLGLWICKRVLELHGGSIRVESVEGQGTRFILYIPPRCIVK